ncbi:MAG: hypothetical protein D6776_01680, partial [Planctomycetota bacterium]
MHAVRSAQCQDMMSGHPPLRYPKRPDPTAWHIRGKHSGDLRALHDAASTASRREEHACAIELHDDVFT